MGAGLRSHILDGKGTVEEIEFDGDKYEIRSPSFGMRLAYMDALSKAPTKPGGGELTTEELRQNVEITIRAKLEVLVACAYDEQGSPVFKHDDVDRLVGARPGPELKAMLAAVTKLLGSSGDDLGKGSGGTGSSNSPA